jgi:hypothetical protein
LSVGGDRGIQGALYDSHEIVFITEDMRVVAKSRRCMIVPTGGAFAFNVRLPDLKYIENILHVQFWVRPDPFTLYGPFWKRIDGNVVGMSIYQANGLTICVDVIAVGPP